MLYQNGQVLIFTMAILFGELYIDVLNDKDNSIVSQTFCECDSAFHALNDIYNIYFT